MTVFTHFGGKRLIRGLVGGAALSVGPSRQRSLDQGAGARGTALAPIAEAFIRGWAVASANLILDGLRVVQFALPLYLF